MNNSMVVRRGRLAAVLGLVLLSSLLAGCRGRGKAVQVAKGPASQSAVLPEDDTALITEAPPANAKDPFQSQAKVATAPANAPGTGPAPANPQNPIPIPIPPPVDLKPPTAPKPPPAAPKPEPKPDSGSHSTPASSKPSGPQMPDKATLKRLDPKEPPEWSDAPQAAEGKLTLIGVVEGQRPQAIFSDDGKVVRKRIGDEVAGLKVISIANRQVLLRDTESGAKAYWLSVKSGSRLGGTRSAPPKAAEPKPSGDGETSKDSGSGEGSKPAGDGGESKDK